jgi:hypothetical protein
MGDSDGSSYTSVKEGGHQIEYEDEDPNIHKEFEAALGESRRSLQNGSLSSSV